MRVTKAGNQPMQIYSYPLIPETSELEPDVFFKTHTVYLRDISRYFRRFSTQNPDHANYFFIPTDLINWQFSRSHPDPWFAIQKLPYLKKGKHILLATGDFGQRHQSPWESKAQHRAYPKTYSWLNGRFHLLALESTSDLSPQDVAFFPYEVDSRIRFLNRIWRTVSRFHRRPLLYSFVGKMSYQDLPTNHIRGGLMFQLAGADLDYFVGEAHTAWKLHGKRGTGVSMMRRSIFTLCPAGYGRWTFRMAQSISRGSIPVVLSDGYVLPFADRIPWDDLIVRVPERNVGKVPQILRKMPLSEIRRRQEAILAWSIVLERDGILEMIGEELCDKMVIETPGN